MSMEDGGKVSSTEDGVASSDDETSESETELMVTTRARRITAGNRYDAVVAQEDAEENEEDEVAMLFAEEEGEDDDFNSDEGDDDADMSSSDDDDQGPNAAAEDLEGEKDLEKEAKAERAKKRKADLALTTIASIRKKPKIDPTSLRRTPAPKPSKRKERVSWLSGPGSAPGRTSLRKQTILHRAETHAKMKENEEQRLKLKAKREKREREREAEAPREMTQADRLAEAERVERRNAKSLNRWEAMEKKRAEEQAAKLAALKDRKLKGAVLTWYSSSAKYIGLKEDRDVEVTAPVEAKKRGRKPKALLEQLAAAKRAEEESAALRVKQDQSVGTTQASNGPALSDASDITKQQPVHLTALPSSEAGTMTDSVQPGASLEIPQARQDLELPENSDASFLNGIHEYASMQPETKVKDECTKTDESAGEAKGTQDHAEAPMSPNLTPSAERVDQNLGDDGEARAVEAPQTDKTLVEPQQPAAGSNSEQAEPVIKSEQDKPEMTDATMTGTTSESVLPPEGAGVELSQQQSTEVSMEQTADHRENSATLEVVLNDSPAPAIDTTRSSAAVAPPADAPQSSSQPPIEVISTRNLVIMDKFDDLSEEARHEFSVFYNNRKSAKPVKHSQELCPITGLPAKYRDPTTGMGYANAIAYKKLQELRKHQYSWSSLLGCYVGRSTLVARGVPEGFMGP